VIVPRVGRASLGLSGAPSLRAPPEVVLLDVGVLYETPASVLVDEATLCAPPASVTPQAQS
jgi:hypothetical protein